MATCESEQKLQSDITLIDTNVHIGGLGLEFGYPENSKRSKDKSKTKLWKLYFEGGYQCLGVDHVDLICRVLL
jgi:hypothetical protein